jgi:hypothetical protein
MENPTEWLLTGQPTPGTANQGLLPLSAQLPLPEISTESRIFSGTLTFTVTAPMGTTLRFTTDGSTPTLSNGTTAPPQTENGHQRYDFSAINNTNYRFRLFKDGSLPSDVATRTFIKATNNYTVAKANADKMRQLYEKLSQDVATLQARRSNIKATVAVAKTQSRINEATAAAESAHGSLAAFDKMEAKAQEMLDRANAEAELNGLTAPTLITLEEKYSGPSDDAVEDELARLKAELGM